MHYVEYHVLMVPRCFHTPLNGASWTDRIFGRLRRHRVLFYGLLLAIAVPITRFTWLGMGALMRADAGSGTVGYRLLISVFDGLFVFHYIIESRIWRFGDPFYRRSLVPLYFRKVAPARAVADEPILLCPQPSWRARPGGDPGLTTRDPWTTSALHQETKRMSAIVERSRDRRVALPLVRWGFLAAILIVELLALTLCFDSASSRRTADGGRSCWANPAKSSTWPSPRRWRRRSSEVPSSGVSSGGTTTSWDRRGVGGSFSSVTSRRSPLSPRSRRSSWGANAGP